MKFSVVIAAFALTAASSARAQQEPDWGAGITATSVDDPRIGPDWGEATGIVDASPETVMTVIRDYGRYAGFLPHFQKSRVLSQRGHNAIVYLEAAILKGTITLWGQVKMYQRRPRGETRILEARMMKGKGNLDHLVARWEVTPIDGGARCRVTMRVLVVPAIPFPDSIVSRENRKAAALAIKALRKRTSTLAANARKRSAV